MAKYKGCSGVVKTGVVPDQIIELVGFTIDETTEALDASVIGAGCTKRVVKGQTAWTGTIDTYYDPNDLGLINIENGALVDVELYPSGEAVANMLFSGNVLITGVSTPIEIEGVITQSYTYEGNGDLTKTEIITP